MRTTRAVPAADLLADRAAFGDDFAALLQSVKRSICVAWPRDFTVSGRACTMNSLPLMPSFAHSMSIGRP